MVKKKSSGLKCPKKFFMLAPAPPPASNALQLGRIARPSKRVVDLLREEERVGDPAYDPELLQRTDSSMLLWNTNANDYIVDESDGIVTGTESRCVRARLCLCAGAFYSSRHVGLAPSSRMQPSRCLASCCMPQAGGVR